MSLCLCWWAALPGLGHVIYVHIYIYICIVFSRISSLLPEHRPGFMKDMTCSRQATSVCSNQGQTCHSLLFVFWESEFRTESGFGAMSSRYGCSQEANPLLQVCSARFLSTPRLPHACCLLCQNMALCVSSLRLELKRLGCSKQRSFLICQHFPEGCRSSGVQHSEAWSARGKVE